MPTPSDGRVTPERSRAEMEAQAQAALNEQSRAVEESRVRHEQYQQAVIPNKGVPPVSGDCVIDDQKY